MIIKRYLVSNMNEALTRIRYELGKDAIIISQRKVRKPGFKGFFSGKLIEVTAAVENAADLNKTNNKKDGKIEDSLSNIKRLLETSDKNTIIEKDENTTIAALNLSTNLKVEEKENSHRELVQDSMYKEVSEMKVLLNRVIENTSKDEIKKIDKIEEKLIDIDVDEEFHEEILSKINSIDDENVDKYELLRSVFEEVLLECSGEISGKIALVGPTGVGKTTTIAKLAGKLSLIDKKNVGLITVDTYRIGAIEQLKTYAEIMNIPFKVVITIKEMEEAINSMKDCDVILIDTTGRSSKNTMQISELRAFVEKANPDYVSMVISATTKNRDIVSILNGYSDLSYDNVIITKLDETTVYGSLYNIMKRSNKPVKYITTGQNVPNDIIVPTKEELARFMLGEETLC
ncbi:flagellar biosynthesis protein FlhF [Clostridium sp. CMCC3677]|uniref:flagellar biosynthesis protein FlhF n=1 Tax=Clostridium sp. CMCC3677 TaxID=2949963 RepID=UPI0013F02822|nr:flagellar biosynthesis protein FlhF [Clostridium sp. CMCC3677]NFG60608.1 flagellar biosynthesis protein FlhF [Clostridium botulinum]NFQ09749.1 flagellar biosynthesis protein FlhF [Clostridium botulinum]